MSMWGTKTIGSIAKRRDIRRDKNSGNLENYIKNNRIRIFLAEEVSA